MKFKTIAMSTLAAALLATTAMAAELQESASEKIARETRELLQAQPQGQNQQGMSPLSAEDIASLAQQADILSHYADQPKLDEKDKADEEVIAAHIILSVPELEKRYNAVIDERDEADELAERLKKDLAVAKESADKLPGAEAEIRRLATELSSAKEAQTNLGLVTRELEKTKKELDGLVELMGLQNAKLKELMSAPRGGKRSGASEKPSETPAKVSETPAKVSETPTVGIPLLTLDALLMKSVSEPDVPKKAETPAKVSEAPAKVAPKGPRKMGTSSVVQSSTSTEKKAEGQQ